MGHSLGSAVAYDAQKQNPNRKLNVVAYNAPVVSQPGDASGQQRSRNLYDPVAMFDKGAKTNANINKDFYNLHFYANNAENTYTANLTPK